VVTRFSFRLHQVGPTITGALIVWSAERADEVLAAYRDLTESAPRELTAATIVRLAPPAPFLPQVWHGKPIVGIQVCHSGANPAADLAAVRALGNPIVDLVGPKPYAALQSMLNVMEPKWLHRYWKTWFLPGLSSEFLDAFRSSALKVTSPLSQSVLFHLAGALNDREGDDGAVGNRDARYIGGFAGTWPPGAPSDPHVAWARDGWERTRPFSTGGNYVNFLLAEDDTGRTAAAYGKNYQRLQRVKATYDPDNLFRATATSPQRALRAVDKQLEARSFLATGGRWYGQARPDWLRTSQRIETPSKVPSALGRLPKTRSPSKWPGTARPAASAGRWLIWMVSRSCRGPGAAAWPAEAHRPTRAQTALELTTERTAALHEQRQVDRVVRHPHHRILRVGQRQPAGDLLG
jgi:Berberine and berberine like